MCSAIKLFTLFFLSSIVMANSAKNSLFDHGSPSFIRIDTGGDANIVATMTSTTGLLWLATSDGLFTYDGYDYEKMPYLDSQGKVFGKVYISSITAGADGVVWAGAMGSGLIKVDERLKRYRVFSHNPGDASTVASDRIHGMIPDGEKGLWLATDKGLDHFDIDTETFTHFDLPDRKGNKFSVVRRGSHGNLLLGSNNGIYSFDIESQVFTDYSGEGAGNLHVKNVKDIYLDDRGRMWVGTWASGVYLIDANRVAKKIANYSLAPTIKRIDDEVWVGTRVNGIAIFDYDTASLKTEERGDRYRLMAFRKDFVTSIYKDENDLVWVGVWNDGLWLATPARKYTRSIWYSPNDKAKSLKNNIQSIVSPNQNETWVSSLGAGIDVFESSSGLKHSITVGNSKTMDLPSNNVVRMTLDVLGDLYVGTTDAGLFRYRKRKNSGGDDGNFLWQRVQCFTEDGKSPENAQHLLPLSDGRTIVMLMTGAHSVGLDKDFSCNLKKVDYSNDSIPWFGVNISGGRAILIAYGKLYLLRPGSNVAEELSYTMEGYSESSEPQLEWGHTLYPGKTFFSTSFGLFSMTEVSDDKFVFTQVHEGRQNSYLFAAHKNKLIWGTTAYWSEDGGRYRNITEADGASDQAGDLKGFVKTSGGDVVIAREFGLQIFRLKNFKEWDHNPPLVIKDFSVKGVAKQGDIRSIELKPNEKDFSITFAALEYSGPQYVRYRYFLDGYSDEWAQADSDNRRATYSNLPPGRYTFKLQSTNRLGVWSDHTLTMPITVLPAWYQRYWFYAFVLICGLTLLFLLYRWRLSYYRHKKIELELLVRERTEDLQETQAALALSEKQASLGRLVNGVAHEFNTPLGIVNLAVSVIQKNTQELFQAFGMASIDDKQVSSRYNKVKDSNSLLDGNLTRLTNLVESFKKISVDGKDWKFSQVNVTDSVNALPGLLRDKINASSANLIIQAQGDYSIYSCSTLLNDILTELVSNALQHGFDKENSQGSVWVNLSWDTSQDKEEPALIIKVEDNGCGIGPELMETVFDPFTAQDPANLGLGLHALVNLVTNVLGGTIECENGKEKGKENGKENDKKNDKNSGCCFTVVIPAKRAD